MLARELAIVLYARITWIAAALSALLVGHGFILAIDLYTAGSRSVAASTLMAQRFDPLAGVVRPTLGGLYLAVSLLGPLVAARAIAVEKERHSFAALLLQTAAPARLVLAKALAAFLGVALQLIAPLALFLIWRALGGHLAFAETVVAVAAHTLYLAWVVALAVAASAWTATLAQAAVVALLVIAASWANDASEGFAALAWLGRAVDWSVTTHLQPMERGTIAVGATLWLWVMVAGALALAWLGVRSDWRRSGRALGLFAALILTLALGAAAHRVKPLIDVSERQRGSLPPAAARELRNISAPISVEVWLDRDDGRRQQLEADTLAKLRIARSDVQIAMPLDERAAPAEGEREAGYGRVVIDVGGVRRETYSTSRRELVTLIFEAAGRSLPDWSQPEYPGYPLIVEGRRRTAAVALAYAGLPLCLCALGWLFTRTRRKLNGDSETAGSH
jgi:hypothetical protein